MPAFVDLIIKGDRIMNASDLYGAGIACSHTDKTFREWTKLHPFSTPLPLSAIMSVAADISEGNLVLEPSAGTGLRAVLGKLLGETIS